MRFISGHVFDVAANVKPNPQKFGKYVWVILDSEKNQMFRRLKDFAHVFYVLLESAIYAYKGTYFYDTS